MKTIEPFFLSNRLNISIVVFACCLLFLISVPPAFSQSFNSHDRDTGVLMLKTIKDDIRKHYYDPTFRGIDLDARFKTAEERIKQANSNGEIFGIIAKVLLDFNDSHTLFLPPSRAARIEYGWRMQMVGDKCYITAVKPQSDAEAKGLNVGDFVQSLDGITPTRENLWVFYYLYNALNPRPVVKITVQSPAERQPRQLELMAKIETRKKITDLSDTIDLNVWLREGEDRGRLRAHRFHHVGDELVIWKMPQFDLSKDEVDDRVNKIKKHKALILDLRGNRGGAEETMLALVGNLIDHDVKVADIKRRKEIKSLVAKSRGDGAFKGQLLVLVDSESASASEVLARVVQLEKRGAVLGDRTSGKVMRSRAYTHQMGLVTAFFYGVNVTDGDVIMSDGNSLERVGVTPDKMLVPSATEIASQQDPVLSQAALLAGVKLDSDKAGKLFPFKWGM
jgi:C-terminal processing protease CtpA/Prc